MSNILSVLNSNTNIKQQHSFTVITAANLC